MIKNLFHLLLAIIILVTAAAAISNIKNDDACLYKILGVARTSTVKEIKSAYRRKALATHPDKNKDKPPEEAAQEFHKVVHAFEVLSDETSRRNYDRTGNSGNSDTNGGQQRQQQWRSSTFQWSRMYQRQSLKDRFEVKEAQSRVMHIVSLDQLKTVMLDDDERLERNLLMVFCTPQKAEQVVDDELVFPYPFAAMSSQGIWWEDLLQTVKVRYHRSNDVTRFFQIPSGDEMRASGSQPILLFGKRGQLLSDPMERLQTNHRPTFDSWVWDRLKVRVVFVNDHDHPVEIFWIHSRNAKLTSSTPLQPGQREEHTTMLSHEWWIRDARVDTRKDSPRRSKLTKESLLGIWKILSDKEGQEIRIRKKTCFDLSGHCSFWESHGECYKNPVFMRQQCLLTCGLCSVDVDDVGDEQKPAETRPRKEPKKDKNNKNDEL